jgi:hypothetical protein
MQAHAEIVVRTPYDDIPLAVRAIPERVGELSRLALQISEHTITLLPLQSDDGSLKISDIVEHVCESLRVTALSHCSRRRPAARPQQPIGATA